MSVKKGIVLLLVAALVFSLAACGTGQRAEQTAAASAAQPDAPDVPNESKKDAEEKMRFFIGNTEVSVAWENNASADALMALAKEKPITIDMSMYGGFEQVGSLGTSLPRNDTQTTTKAGDIVLYAGNQIVVFYGSNAWAYTRLGRITDKNAAELAELLGGGSVTITITNGGD